VSRSDERYLCISQETNHAFICSTYSASIDDSLIYYENVERKNVERKNAEKNNIEIAINTA